MRRMFVYAARRNTLSSLVLLALGAFVVWESTHYQLGVLSRMGPGFFPMALGLILIGLGVVLLLHGVGVEATEDEEGVGTETDFRGWLNIIAGIAGFIILGRYGGLVPATFFLVFCSAMADRGNSWKSAAILALAMSAVGAVVFVYLLGVQFPLFRWG